MSTAADFEITELNRSLAVDGQTIMLQRLTGTSLVSFAVTCRALVRNFDAKELIGGITQDQSNVILSPSEITAAGWPGPNNSATPTNQDRRVPRTGDKCVIAGKQRNIDNARPFYLDNVLIRIELRVLG